MHRDCAQLDVPRQPLRCAVLLAQFNTYLGLYLYLHLFSYSRLKFAPDSHAKLSKLTCLECLSRLVK